MSKRIELDTEDKIDKSVGFASKKKPTDNKKWVVFLTMGLLFLVGGVACLTFALLKPEEKTAELMFPEIPSKSISDDIIYSPLTGEIITDASLINAPTFCIQTPNGTDGARPQAGLNTAGVIFEAIAEAGITRFAAIYQNPTSAIIGPIRSLRMYYLEWDTPFNCTIVHAGGADDAIAAVRAGGYRDLTENYSYMYRGTYGARRWNNLFTTRAELKQFNSDRGYETSDVKGFTRMTPEESNKARIDSLTESKLSIVTPTTADTNKMTAKATEISFRFGGWPNFNAHYSYDINSNKYLRSYESGNKHDVYSCPEDDLGEKNPEDVCTLIQMAPSVVIAMIVQERKASDNYHESITTIGSGDAYIFQNGDAIKGTWRKNTRDDQIRFFNASGEEVKLAPGQTMISAVPTYGSVDF